MTTITEQLAEALRAMYDARPKGDLAFSGACMQGLKALDAYDGQPKDKARALLIEFDNRFGDAVAEDIEIDACDAVDFLTDFAMRVRAALES